MPPIGDAPGAMRKVGSFGPLISARFIPLCRFGFRWPWFLRLMLLRRKAIQRWRYFVNDPLPSAS